ncbi:MAG: hypothetical protein A2X94_15955 [Bdellovibrionales bacterium GWB1_55_8]|nr:MAG: hypothetical protein A2X94_15955 [Bdellovibrionales bacterium GWB1_55_8]
MQKDKDLLEAEIHRRTRRSLITGILASALGVGAWRWLWKQEENNGTPWPLRQMLRFNEKLGRALFDRNRLTVQPETPPVGQPIRENGKLGLDSSSSTTEWRLEVLSEARSVVRRSFSMEMLKTLPRTETTTEFKCIEGWTEKMSYAGIRFSDFLSALYPDLYLNGVPGILPPYVALETPDQGYYVSIDIESMLHPQTILAYEMNGIPLSQAHGAPLRLLIPVKYGIKSLKKVGQIYFSGTRPRDYWAERGYDWYAGL